MTVGEKLEKCHELVWKFREKQHKHWKNVSPVWALRYALSELGEALSDLCREQLPNNFRSRDKEPEVCVELADAAIMLITALGKDFVYPDIDELIETVPDDEVMLDSAAVYLSYALAESHRTILKGRILNSLRWIERYVRKRGYDLEDLIAWKLSDIEAKIEYRQSAEYEFIRDGADFCPNCDDGEVYKRIDTWGSGEVQLKVECSHCNSEWTEFYEIREVDFGKVAEDENAGA